jgi:hypothetical protein
MLVDPEKIQITDFTNQGLDKRFVKYQYTREDMEPVWQEINKVIEDADNAIDYRSHLAGHIREEYQLADAVKPHVNRLLAPLIEQYSRFVTLPKALGLGSVWVNLQRKNEFNPPHTHDGLLSFVMWMKIPYAFSVEDKDNQAKKPLSGRFGFIIPVGDECKTMYLDSDSNAENTIVLFPANLMHFVNPFQSSDELRITVSANYYETNA